MTDGEADPNQLMPAREVALRLGLSIATVRYYDHAGLIDERYIGQGADGKRAYDDVTVTRLRALIEACGGAGLPIHEMRTIAAALDDGTLTDERQLELLQQALVRLDYEVDRLGAVRHNLAAKIAQLQERDG
ncbi:MerR family transcriptional regulator [Catenulispora pinisilvae]|uniref:MerR family transcriptional regulator n=1 Tax=Catenulispora pinisilvae TaxID=2705253 RepID=UPI0018912604|nr:MerR family transcriptional regulator [Catenulispora pinisilvae]